MTEELGNSFQESIKESGR